MQDGVRQTKDGLTEIVRMGYAEEFKEMILELRRLQYETGTKEAIQEAGSGEPLRVILSANSPLKVVKVEKISEEEMTA